MRFSHVVASCAVVFLVAGCSRDSGSGKTDSAAADSIRAAQAATDSSTAVGTGYPTDSVQAPINSTEGTIGETRKRAGMHAPDTMDRDSVIRGPYKTMDSVGAIKR
jgi:hypothetical protein